MSDHRDRERAIMRARAQALAAPRESPVTGERIDVVEFRLAGESCAVAARQVQAAIALRDFTPMPRSRSAAVGLAEWRGSLLTLVDMRRPLGLPSPALDDLRHVLIVGDQRRCVGVLVETVVGTRSIDIATMQPPSRASEQRLVMGLTADALVVLDGAALVHLTRTEIS